MRYLHLSIQYNNISSTECGVPPEGIFNFQFSLRITDCLLYYCGVLNMEKCSRIPCKRTHKNVNFNSSMKLTQANQRLKNYLILEVTAYMLHPKEPQVIFHFQICCYL